ncbi:hypothetical protein BDZ89DRAFT_1164078 [Hymenopellis radicata]|nr:hypothetical protein BDZ89DRAFT_1164078 [Hymenopellis radicata]
MVQLLPRNPLLVAYTGLLLSIALNLSAVYVFRYRRETCQSILELKEGDDSHFSYIGDDYPHELPIHLPTVGMKVENSERFGLSDFYAWGDWRTTDMFPASNGFIKLGPNGRKFGIAMFHQMHCLQKIRDAIVQGDAGHHTRHCLNLLRQTVLCASDTTLDPMINKHSIDGLGIVHVCRDWETVFDFVTENQLKYLNTSEGWNG